MATLNGGAALQVRLREIAQRLDSAKSVSAGIHEGATYPDGTSVALVGTVQEYGSASRGIPPRPYLRPAIAQHSKEWGDVIAGALKSGDYDASRALELVGTRMAEDIQQGIQDVTSPALKPETIARKGFSKPLIDTEFMREHIDHEVHE